MSDAILLVSSSSSFRFLHRPRLEDDVQLQVQDGEGGRIPGERALDGDV